MQGGKKHRKRSYARGAISIPGFGRLLFRHFGEKGAGIAMGIAVALPDINADPNMGIALFDHVLVVGLALDPLIEPEVSGKCIIAVWVVISGGTEVFTRELVIRDRHIILKDRKPAAVIRAAVGKGVTVKQLLAADACAFLKFLHKDQLIQPDPGALGIDFLDRKSVV